MSGWLSALVMMDTLSTASCILCKAVLEFVRRGKRGGGGGGRRGNLDSTVMKLM